MAKVPTYQRAAIPGRAVQIAPIDAGGMISMLEDFQNVAEQTAIREAEIGALELGAVQGAEAAAGGAQLPLGRKDTAAGQAFNKAARASYMGQLENDIQEVSDDFVRKWDAGEYEDDAEQWAKGYDAAVKGLSKGLDDETRAVYGPRLDSISNRTKKGVFDDFQKRTQEKQKAEVLKATEVITDDLLGFARDGDIFEIEANKQALENLLDSAVEGRLFTAPDVEKLILGISERVTAEAYIGDFNESEDMRDFLDAFKEKRPSDLTPEEHERLSSDMEARLDKIERENITTTADWFMTQWGGFDVNEQRENLAVIEDPKLKAAVSERIERDEGFARTLRAGLQGDTIEAYYDDIFNKGAVPTTDSIDLNETLTSGQKLMVKSWIETGKPGEMGKVQRAQGWYEAQKRIISGEWDEQDVMDNLATGMFDVQDTKSLVGFARGEKGSIAKLQQVQTELQAVYPTVWKNEKKRAQTVYGILEDINRYEEETGTRIDPETRKGIIHDNAKGFVESGYFTYDPVDVDILQEEYEGIDEPFGKQAAEGAERLDLWQREVLRARRGESSMAKGTWANAFWSDTMSVMVLGEKDGEMHYIYEGRHKAMSLEEWGK